jgi:hypothetical protein
MLTARQTVRKMLTAGQNAFYSKTKRMITTEQNAKIQRLSFRRNLALHCVDAYSSTKTQRLSFCKNLAAFVIP